MTVQTALLQGVSLLEEGGVPVPRLTAELLLAHAVRSDRVYLYAHSERELTEMEWLHYGRYLHERLQGKPSQYITGKQEFYGREFRVTPDVLIPRPETEHVVEVALKICKGYETSGHGGAGFQPAMPASLPAFGAERRQKWRRGKPEAHSTERPCERPVHAVESLTFGSPCILDMGTGSGALAATLALETSAVTWATDISHPAAKVAAENSRRLCAEVRIVVCDVMEAIASRSMDLIVSNPPYVPAGDRDGLQREVRDWEPHVALFAGDTGFEMYSRIVAEAARVLRPGGWLVMELGFGSLDRVVDLLAGWSESRVEPDLAGIPRVIAARLAA